MLDIKFIRENPEEIKKVINLKNIKLDIDELLSLDSQRGQLLISLESLRAERNQNATYMKKAGKPEQEVIEKGRELKQLIQEKEDQLKQIENH